MSLSQAVRASAVHVGVAFLLTGAGGVGGAIAAIAPLRRIAGRAQGVMSGLLTLGLKQALEATAPRLSVAAAYILPPLAGFLLISAFLTGVHRLTGTPEIAGTVAFPLTISTSYAVISALLVRKRRK